jgi:two-component system response regulator HydG
LFLQADGGTLFLDEIGDMPLGLQPKLLRALQERTVRPVGSSAEHSFDARLITATNRDIEAAVEDKRFRGDLYYRVNVVHLELPPLRARGGDVILLATAFLERLAPRSGKPIESLTQSATERLLAYDWPGNVRELSNCMERAVALARGNAIDVADLPRRVQDYQTSHVVVAADDPSELVPLETVEKRYVLRVLSTCNGNKTRAARILGLSRKTLYRRLEAFGVPVDDQE